MPLFEITIERPDGHWHYWTASHPDFHAACEAGVARAIRDVARLIRVENVSGMRSSAEDPRQAARGSYTS
jgi:hypothetical protein